MIEIISKGFDIKNFDRKSSSKKNLIINVYEDLTTSFHNGKIISQTIQCEEYLIANFKVNTQNQGFCNQFDLSEFDVKHPNVRVTSIEVICTESSDIIFYFSQRVEKSFHFVENLKTTFDGANTKELEFKAVESLNSQFNIIHEKNLHVNVIETLNTNFYLGVIMNKNISINENLNTNFYLGMLRNSKPITASNSLKLNFLLSINMFKFLRLSTIMNCEFTGNFMEYVVCNINTTLYPNDELRIDSDLFNVMVNGQNAIHLQQGDWIHLDKNSKDILIETGTGGLLNGQIIYKERYL